MAGCAWDGADEVIESTEVPSVGNAARSGPLQLPCCGMATVADRARLALLWGQTPGLRYLLLGAIDGPCRRPCLKNLRSSLVVFHTCLPCTFSKPPSVCATFNCTLPRP